MSDALYTLTRKKDGSEIYVTADKAPFDRPVSLTISNRYLSDFNVLGNPDNLKEFFTVHFNNVIFASEDLLEYFRNTMSERCTIYMDGKLFV